MEKGPVTQYREAGFDPADAGSLHYDDVVVSNALSGAELPMSVTIGVGEALSPNAIRDAVSGGALARVAGAEGFGDSPTVQVADRLVDRVHEDGKSAWAEYMRTEDQVDTSDEAMALFEADLLEDDIVPGLDAPDTELLATYTSPVETVDSPEMVVAPEYIAMINAIGEAVVTELLSGNGQTEDALIGPDVYSDVASEHDEPVAAEADAIDSEVATRLAALGELGISQQVVISETVLVDEEAAEVPVTETAVTSTYNDESTTSGEAIYIPISTAELVARGADSIQQYLGSWIRVHVSGALSQETVSSVTDSEQADTEVVNVDVPEAPANTTNVALAA